MGTLVILLRRYTIRTRMLGAVALVLFMFALIGAAALLAGGKIRQINQQFMERSIVELENTSGLKDHLAQMRLVEKQMVIDYENEAAVQKLRARWQAELAATRKGLEALLQGQPNDKGNDKAKDSQAVAREALTHLAAYEKGLESVLQNMLAGNYDNSRAADRMLARSKAEIAATEEGVARIVRIARDDIARTQAEFDGTMTTLLASFGVVLLFVLVVIAPMTMLNSRSITEPIAEARDAALAIAGGDLTRHIVPEGRDEAAELLAALARMQVRLAALVGEVHSASASIRIASTEVAAGNADLSQRTEQAAGSLQQTASAMSQLSGTVQQTAASARTADQLATGATQVAQRGGQVVAEVVTTMDEINASSRRIGDIIGVIDGIAFQTNILALNAAVEAARAGEQGRGFAVVASEVRSLAQRAAQAAREIKALIGNSVDRVDAGARLVADAGKTMGEIVGSVHQVSHIIAEISTAAAEQSSGLGGVNGSVAELDRMTQQNAALVEQSAAAAMSLQQQTQHLASMVSTFRTAEQPA